MKAEGVKEKREVGGRNIEEERGNVEISVDRGGTEGEGSRGTVEEEIVEEDVGIDKVGAGREEIVGTEGEGGESCRDSDSNSDDN